MLLLGHAKISNRPVVPENPIRAGFARSGRIRASSDAMLAILHLLGTFVGDEVLDARCRHRRVNYQHSGRDHRKRYRREVLLRAASRRWLSAEPYVKDDK